MNKIKVMIVDDEMEFATTLNERLILRNFDSRAVCGAEKAIAVIVSGWIPDVVLMDLKMPVMDGIESLELIKQHEPSIEVIILTGHGSTASGIEGMQKGLFDYLMKPVDIGELVERINAAVEKKMASKNQI